MDTYGILAKKRDGGALTPEEIEAMVAGYTKGDVADYQMAAFLMAVFLRGMTPQETAQLTLSMARSGDMVDLSAIPGIKADKHSTGGVGDKTTLVAAPLAAACGLKIAKMSGRGLGHTGGTVDKLEAIPGMRMELGREEFFEQVRSIGIAVAGQSGNLAPADKKIYALRDVTATVDNLPLIASSIMSKKLAAGSDVILLDVKTGSGAFMKTLEDSVALARAMVDIGLQNGRKTAALITDMDVPLGRCIGNSLEVAEAVQTLRGEGPQDLTEVSLELAEGMMALAGQAGREECRLRAVQALRDGSGLARLRQMVEWQGGDAGYIDEPERFAAASVQRVLCAPQAGYICGMDAQAIGGASVALGAGRRRKQDAIDHTAGIVLMAKTGEAVRPGQPLAVLHTSSEQKADEAEQIFLQAVAYSEQKPPLRKLILARVDEEGVHSEP